MAQVQAALDLQRLGKGESDQLPQKLVAGPNDSESWVALGDTYRASNMFAEAVVYTSRRKGDSRSPKRDWTMFYARAMAKEKIKRLDESEADILTALKLSAGSARAAELSRL
jgi:cytochrome c-type biogenesis protein CcmH/NrfG